MKIAFKCIFLYFLLSFAANSYAQELKKICPVCYPDSSCISNPAYPSTCPSSALPDGQVSIYYNQVISMYLPAHFNDKKNGLNYTFLEFEIMDIQKLPPGLSYMTDIFPATVFHPSKLPPYTERGCFLLSGSPLSVYDDSLCIVGRTLLLGPSGDSVTVMMNFKLHMKIQTATAITPGFSVTNSSGCPPLTASFINNIPSNGNTSFQYTWNFGNGDKSYLENPPSYTYYAPGNYNVVLQTKLDTFYISQIEVLSSSCTDSLSAPDLYVVIKEGTKELLNTKFLPYASVTNTKPPVKIKFRPLMLTNRNYAIEIMDEDMDEMKADDTCAVASFNGVTTGIFLKPLAGAEIRYEVAHGSLIFKDTVTVKVLTPPAIPLITYVTGDTVCAGDSVLLSTQTAYSYTWYHLSSMIGGATSSTYYAKLDGDYVVHVTESNGCSSHSSPANLIFNVLNKPSVSISSDSSTLYTDSVASSLKLQWYLDGNPIPGATQTSYTADVPGYYHLIVYDKFSCFSVSDSIYISVIPTHTKNLKSNPGQLTLYPDPCNGIFTMCYYDTKPVNARIRILDLSGRMLFSEHILSPELFSRKSFNVSDLAPGVYILNLSTDNAVLTRKIVINN